MAKSSIRWDHSALEAALDDFTDEALEAAQRIKERADSMRSRPAVAPYNVSLREGPSERKQSFVTGGRHYAVVSADAPSTKADQARTNALQKAAG